MLSFLLGVFGELNRGLYCKRCRRGLLVPGKGIRRWYLLEGGIKSKIKDIY